MCKIDDVLQQEQEAQELGGLSLTHELSCAARSLFRVAHSLWTLFSVAQQVLVARLDVQRRRGALVICSHSACISSHCDSRPFHTNPNKRWAQIPHWNCKETHYESHTQNSFETKRYENLTRSAAFAFLPHHLDVQQARNHLNVLNIICQLGPIPPTRSACNPTIRT